MWGLGTDCNYENETVFFFPFCPGETTYSHFITMAPNEKKMSKILNLSAQADESENISIMLSWHLLSEPPWVVLTFVVSLTSLGSPSVSSCLPYTQKVMQPISKKSRCSCPILGIEMMREWLNSGLSVPVMSFVSVNSMSWTIDTLYFTRTPLQKRDLWISADLT